MAFYLSVKKLDQFAGDEYVVLLNSTTAKEHAVEPGDHVLITAGRIHFVCIVNTSEGLIDKKSIGVFKDIFEKFSLDENIKVSITLIQRAKSVEYIKKKIKRYELDYDEIKAIMVDVISGKLGIVEKTYFLSTIYNPGYNDNEVYYLTKAMAETGQLMKFDGIVADKHSIGGIPGKGITPLVVSIVSSFGIKMPNTSTRSITTPAGTSDILETIMDVSFTFSQIEGLVEKINCCMVWGGSLDIAPADDILIKVEVPMGIESFDKLLISIVAKKVAMGINYLIVDIPAGTEGKVSHPEDVESLKNKFIALGARFGIKVQVSERYPLGIDGNAVGPKLEMREVLYIFENSNQKSHQLEEDALKLSGILLEMCGKADPNQGYSMAKEALCDGRAYNKFKEIIKAQRGREDVSSEDLTPQVNSLTFKAVAGGNIKLLNDKKIVELARLLGCPADKSAGIYFFKKPEDEVKINDKMFSIYSTTPERLKLGIEYIKENNLFVFE